MTNTTKILIGLSVGSLALIWLHQARKKEPVIRSMKNIPFGQNAITLPPFGIFIAKSEVNNLALINHELVHWAQYQRMGLLPATVHNPTFRLAS